MPSDRHICFVPKPKEIADLNHSKCSVTTLNDFPIRVLSDHFARAKRIEVATPNIHLIAVPARAAKTPFRNASLRFRIHEMLSCPVMDVGSA
jgi:hypothetical protein